MVALSEALASFLDKRSFLDSSILRKSEILSSSACKDPELATPGSIGVPKLGWMVDELTLTLPLEILSSSVLLAPPEDSRALLWLKELLYFEIGAGLGDPDVDDAIALSDSCAGFLNAMGALGGGILLLPGEMSMDPTLELTLLA